MIKQYAMHPLPEAATPGLGIARLKRPDQVFGIGRCRRDEGPGPPGIEAAWR
ncbi:hypothetical protein [Methylotetracoccus oryzae]|uniref:hypothetical protein n=1 Tax=Methylotetracoccus oryzae TaxID=1919059 RepID=UPI0013A580B1|nr:hypothetical protein [Methylotetracoccus oryzae]